MTTKELVKRGFDILGLNLGDIIEVQLIGAISKKAKFKITEEVYETLPDNFKKIFCKLEQS